MIPHVPNHRNHVRGTVTELHLPELAASVLLHVFTPTLLNHDKLIVSLGLVNKAVSSFLENL
jgi:hypothetical protein